MPRDVRLRLLLALGLAFACASVTALALVPVALALALGVAFSAGMGARALARALRWPGLLVLGLSVVLPFASGETALWRFGPLVLRVEGLQAAALIAGRALAVVTLALALLGTVPMTRLVAGLRALGLPDLMADIALMMHRYLVEFARDLAAMRLAMALRGQPWCLRLAVLRGFGWMLASLLLRAHERAERIWVAMRLRGHGRAPPDPPPPMTRDDLLRAGLWGLSGAALPLAQVLL